MVEEERVHCDHCERSVASSRYAPHLEKCMLKKATRQSRTYKQLYETVYEKKIDEEEFEEFVEKFLLILFFLVLICTRRKCKD